MFYTKFHSNRSIFYSPNWKCIRIGKRASVSFPHWCLTQSCMAMNHHNCRPDSGWHQWRFIAMCDCRIPVTSQRSHIWKLHFSVHPDFPVDIVSGGKIWLLLGCYSVLLIKLLGVGSKRMTLSGVDSGQWILYSGWHENLLGLKPSLFRFSFHSAAGFTELDPTPQAQFLSLYDPYSWKDSLYIETGSRSLTPSIFDPYECGSLFIFECGSLLVYSFVSPMSPWLTRVMTIWKNIPPSCCLPGYHLWLFFRAPSPTPSSPPPTSTNILYWRR